jgi:hypothetical protein
LKKKLPAFLFLTKNKLTTMLRNVARIARPLAVRSLAPAVSEQIEKGGQYFSFQLLLLLLWNF